MTSDTTRNIYQHWQLLQTYTRDSRLTLFFHTHSIDVTVGDETIPLRLYEGDVLESACTAFTQRHGISTSAVPTLVEKAMEQIKNANANANAQLTPAVDANGRKALVTLAVSMDVPAGEGESGEESGEQTTEQSTEQSTAETPNAGAPKTKQKQLPAISLFEHETPEDAAVAYCVANGLDPDAVAPRLADVLRRGAAKRASALAEADAEAEAGAEVGAEGVADEATEDVADEATEEVADESTEEATAA